MQHRRGVFDVELLEDSPGYIAVAVTGDNAKELFVNESGGHRWQRIPPTEKRGRLQTSTVTVAVMDSDETIGEPLNMKDVTITATRGSGAGDRRATRCQTASLRRTNPQESQSG